jgi:hypothetical protein
VFLRVLILICTIIQNVTIKNVTRNDKTVFINRNDLPKMSYNLCYRFLVRVSYLEIYNESVRDLLGKDQNAQLEVSCLDIPLP